MSEAPPTRRRDPVFLAGLAVVLVLALALRWPLLSDGPGYGNHDEMNVVPKAVHFGGGDLNPHYFHNPPFMAYLAFGGHLVWYAVGRATGTFASPLDFKAQYVADAAPAFFVARLVVLAIALAGIVHTAFLARRLVRDGSSERARRVAGWAAALAMAASQLHAAKSATATNEMLVTVLFTLTAHAALVLAASPSLRTAALAGAAAGLAGGAKYTGALAVLPVVAACVVAPALRPAERLKLLVAAGAACLLAFLVVCPWAVLDAKTFHDHVIDLFGHQDRFRDGQGWLRYLDTAWTMGLGPVWSLATVLALGVACLRIVRGPATERASRLVMSAAILGLAAFLMTRETNSMGRFLLPAFPCCAALAAAELASIPRWGTRLAAIVAVGWAVVASMDLPELWRAGARVDPRDEMAAWMKANVPDGAIVIADVHQPWLPDWNLRREFEGKVPPLTWAKLTPAFRVTTPYLHFGDPLERVVGTDVRVDDWPRIAELGPSYALVTSLARDVFTYLPPGDYPGAAWQASVAKSLTLVHEVPANSPTSTSVFLYAVPR